MLYNPEWKKPNPMSIDDFMSWLATKPFDGEYNFLDANSCIMFQWAHHCDSRAFYITEMPSSFAYSINGAIVDFEPWRVIAHRGSLKEAGNYTYGDALIRAQKFANKPSTKAKSFFQKVKALIVG